MPLIVLHVSTLVDGPLSRTCTQSLPSIISKAYSSKRDECADHDRRRRRASHALGLSPWPPPCAHGYRHCRGVAPSARRVVCIAQNVASVECPSSPAYRTWFEVVSSNAISVGFESIRFDLATMGLIGMTGRGGGFLSSHRVVWDAVSRPQMENPKTPAPSL